MTSNLFTPNNKQSLNLKLGAVVVSYAVGIAVGARLFSGIGLFGSGAEAGVGEAVDGSAAFVWLLGTILAVLVFAMTAVCVTAVVYWFGSKRDPRVVSAYLLIVSAFMVVGVVAGARVDLSKVANGPWAANEAIVGGANGLNTGIEGREASDLERFDRYIATKGRTKPVGNFAGAVVGAKARIIEARVYVRRVMEARLPKDEAGLMMGVLLGDTSTVPADVKADFKTTGLSHILAVSGLNITILIAACAFLSGTALIGIDTPGRVTPGRFLIFAVTAGAIVFYMALCGFAPSIVRAGFMGLAAMAAPLAGRQTSVFSAMAAAAMALLIIDPATVFNIGFQLSFAATLSIMLFSPHVTSWISATPDAPSGVAKALAVTISAQLGVAPILAANFGSISLITPAANAAVAPAIAPAQLLGIVIPMLNIISEPLAAAAAYPAHLSLAYTMAGASFFAKWPLASIGVPQPTAASTVSIIIGTVITAVYFAALAALYIFLRYCKPRTKFTEIFHGRILARTIMIAAGVGVLLIGLFAYRSLNGAPPDGLRVTFLDVGQGDSTLIQARDGATILIDGGPEADSAEARLRERAINNIDLLIITHPHADHVNGLPAVVQDHPIEKAIIPPDESTNNQYLRTLEKLNGNGVAQVAAREGQYYKVGRDLTVKILSPDDTASGPDDTNNQAVVALIQYKGIKMLFTGDIEIETEEDMIADGEAQKVDILKVPHHGSRNGADAALLKILKPRFAVISVGAGNRYHHPAPTTLALLRQVGASVFRTDKNGSVTIESDGKTISAIGQR